MGRIIQVLLYSVLILSVYSQHQGSRTREELEERQRLTLTARTLSNLLRTAARLAYPITAGINRAVGNLVTHDDYPPSSNYYPYDSYERRPVYASGRRGKKHRNNAGRNGARADSPNLRRRNGHDVNRRRKYIPTYYDYDYDYEYDYDSQYLDSLEDDDDYLYNNYGIQSETKSNSLNVNRPSLVAETPDNVPKYKSLPEPIHAKNPVPKVQSVVGSKTVIPKTATKILNFEGPDNNAIAPANSNRQKPIYPNNSERMILSKSVPNLQNPPPAVNPPLTNTGNVLGNVPATNDVQPNIIYVVVKPDGIDPGKEMHNQDITGENRKFNADNGYNYNAPADAGSGAVNVNKPINFIPSMGVSNVDISQSRNSVNNMPIGY